MSDTTSTPKTTGNANRVRLLAAAVAAVALIAALIIALLSGGNDNTRKPDRQQAQVEFTDPLTTEQITAAAARGYEAAKARLVWLGAPEEGMQVRGVVTGLAANQQGLVYFHNRQVKGKPTAATPYWASVVTQAATPGQLLDARTAFRQAKAQVIKRGKLRIYLPPKDRDTDGALAVTGPKLLAFVQTYKPVKRSELVKLAKRVELIPVRDAR